jgi:hypothetical protein
VESVPEVSEESRLLVGAFSGGHFRTVCVPRVGVDRVRVRLLSVSGGFLKRVAITVVVLALGVTGCGGGDGSESSGSGGGSLADRQRTFVAGARVADVFPSSASDDRILKVGEVICGNLKDGMTYERTSILLDPSNTDNPGTRAGRAVIMEGAIRYLCPDQR